MKVTPIRFNCGRSLAMAFGALATSTVTALAHPGHDHAVTPPQHPLHMFIEPQHLVGWIGAGCIAVVAVKAYKAWNRSVAATQTHSERIKPSHD